MKDVEQMAWQKEVILEEFLDSMKERNGRVEGMDEEMLEDLLMQRRNIQ